MVDVQNPRAPRPEPAAERLGERPVAVVVPGDGFDADAFLAWAKDNVAGYRRPREVVEVDVLPRGNNEKVDRAAATDLAVERTGDSAA